MRPAHLSVLVVLLWGCNWPASFLALGGMPPLTFRVASLAVGGVVLLLYCALRGITLRWPRPQLGRLVFSSILNVAAWNLLSVYAIVELNSARAAILAFTMPLWTVLIEWLLGQAPTRPQRFALGLSSLGLAGLLMSVASDASFSAPGAAAMLLAALAWACGTVYVRRRPVDLPRESFAAWTLLLGALMVGTLLPLQASVWPSSPPAWPALIAFVYAALIGMALCQACWFALLGKLGPTASALALLGIPPVGVLSSWLLLRSPVATLDIASLVLLLAAAALPALAAARPRMPS